MNGPASLTDDPIQSDALLGALVRSYEGLVGRPFPTADSDGTPAWNWLYEAAPFALLVHDGADDPAFLYANTTAQRLFEYTWDEFVGMPSRLSAAPGQDRSERARMFLDLENRGFCAGYRGRRVTRSGRAFMIEDATIWNVLDDAGERFAQAALLFRTSPE